MLLVIHVYFGLSAVRKVLEIIFQALGSFETLGSKLSHGTSKKVADVRNHIRKVSKNLLSQILISLYLKYSLFYYKDKLARDFPRLKQWNSSYTTVCWMAFIWA